MEKKIVVAWSGGKDSTTMLLRMLELGERIDKIVFADPLYEYNELYDYMSLVAEKVGFEYEIIRAPKDALYSWAFGKVTRGANKGIIRGFPLTTAPCWYMREQKVNPINKLRGKDSIVCIGYAADEESRWRSQPEDTRYPLVEWGWSEADCIEYLNKRELFNPLYVNFNRSGCFWCPLMSQSSLWATWKAYPEEWQKSVALDKLAIEKTGRSIRMDGTLEKWEKKFQAGFKPKKGAKYSCWNGCEGVKRAFDSEQFDLCRYKT